MLARKKKTHPDYVCGESFRLNFRGKIMQAIMRIFIILNKIRISK